ncbi:MAG: HAMP domain-containing histidine kinase [Oscillospiraceae bacterium]|nr:HAMP domain-containing histidine kinase [Oscillospiraceae bacterium]
MMLFSVVTATIVILVSIALSVLTIRSTLKKLEASLEEEVRAAKQLLAAENAALEELAQINASFLQDIKHEVRNPLHVISLGVDYVYEYFEPKGDAKEARKVLATMQNEALRLGRMVEGMVELASAEGRKLSREKIDFAAMLISCTDNYRFKLASNRNVLQVKISDDLPYVYVESEQLTRVIINILSNANDSVTGGMISIEAFTDNSYIIVHIRDNGSGIDPYLIPRVFERGVSGKNNDGYGLAICKTIVEAHGGTVRIESGELRVESRNAVIENTAAFISGSVVTFTIPVYGGQGN